jgi:metal-sulfur cluster biosynthetic enzyme
MTDTTTDPMQGWPHEEEGHGAGATEGGALRGVELDEDGYPTEAAMLKALTAVLDPEIGINIVDLGLVYGVEATDGVAHVTMTLTTMGCPLTELLHQQCTLVLTRLPNIDDADVEFTFSPPWSTDMMSDEAKEELRAMGFNV